MRVSPCYSTILSSYASIHIAPMNRVCPKGGQVEQAVHPPRDAVVCLRDGPPAKHLERTACRHVEYSIRT